jgi:hypothetical protein
MNRQTKKIIFFVALALLSSACNKQSEQGAPAPSPAYNYNRQLQIGGQILIVEIATTFAEMEQGLSGRNSMRNNEGMLFDFDKETTPAFWMKDMKFSIDLIWINKNKIVGITADVPYQIQDESLKIKGATLPQYTPPSAVDNVLEVNAGWAKKNNIRIGDEVKLIN